MDELKEPIEDAFQMPPDTNVRHLDRVHSERHGDEPRGLAPEKIESRESSIPSSPPRADPAERDGDPKRRSLLRPILFALLPIALVIGGYLYVTGGALMETDNA